jgi:carbon storage regulator
MLIIARRKGQRIVIGHDVEVIVTELSRGSVKLGIVAPSDRSILRGEIKDAVEAANRAAIETSLDSVASAPNGSSNTDATSKPRREPERA